MSEFQTLKELVAIDSPSGYTKEACTYIFDLLTSYGWKPEYTNKQAVRCSLGPNPTLAIAAHVDTLGAIVSGIKKDGTLNFSRLGGLGLNSFEGGYCSVIKMNGKRITGTMLKDNPSAHANNDLESATRKETNMHIRLDEEVYSKEDVQKLGIEIGDIIVFDTNYQEHANGFIKSRFMDNKAGCYTLFEIAKKLGEDGRTAPVELFFSNYEEVGHGGTCGYSPSIEELLVIDMGVLGEQCDGRETTTSICAKDSSGPYDYEFRKKLVELAKSHNIPYRQDVYPYYGSDGSAALRAGNDFRVALIGPGVAASHGVERTHAKGIRATTDLCLAYIDAKFA